MEFVQQGLKDYSDEARETSNFFPSSSCEDAQDCSPSSRCTNYDLSLGCNYKDVVREHMFEKVVTPSDVGKLNRLVIPKQHAERYFPLDSTTHDKGLLLNFEDRSGKPWRFRYSYWNSSQSYVMTKGWSRFVKDKNLHAGDIVSFHLGPRDRLFIDWRQAPLPHNLRWASANMPPQPHYHYNYNYNYHNHPYHRQLAMQQRGHVPMVIDSVPLLTRTAAVEKNKLRLFGVNMECGMATDDDGDPNSRRVVPALLPTSDSQFSEKGKSSLSFDLDFQT